MRTRHRNRSLPAPLTALALAVAAGAWAAAVLGLARPPGGGASRRRLSAGLQQRRTHRGWPLASPRARARAADERRAPAVIRSALEAGAPGLGSAPAATRNRVEAANADPDARRPALRTDHLALLATRPLLQRLPFSDHSIGVALVGVAAGGRPVLLVTRRVADARARRDLGALIARVRDRARNYVIRFRPAP